MKYVVAINFNKEISGSTMSELMIVKVESENSKEVLKQALKTDQAIDVIERGYRFVDAVWIENE